MLVIKRDGKKESVKFDKSLAWASLVKQCDFGPRPPFLPSHQKCQDYIEAELKKTCDTVRLQPFTHKWSTTGSTVSMANVIGEQNWKEAKTRVLLIAHWDTRPTADQESDEESKKKPILGADDGASGVAVLIELSRVMKAANPDLGIMYLMVDGEDLGPGIDEMFLGAVEFSKHLPDPKPDYGILLDMIGNKGVSVPIEPNSLQMAGTVVRSFYRFQQANQFAKTFPATMGPTIEDDHLSLNQAGVPTIDLIDFSYPSWHTLADTVDKCSADSLYQIGGALELWLTKNPRFHP